MAYSPISTTGRTAMFSPFPRALSSSCCVQVCLRRAEANSPSIALKTALANTPIAAALQRHHVSGSEILSWGHLKELPVECMAEAL